MAAGNKKPAEKKTETAGIGRSLRDVAEEQLARVPERSADLKEQTPEQLVHELQVHQIELETQAEELRQANLALAESRDKYLDLYEFAPLGYLTLTDKSLITDVNFNGAILLGIERSKLLKAPFSKFVAEKDGDEWYRYFMNVLNQTEKRTCTLMLKRNGGSLFPAQLEAILITRSDGANTVRVAIIDITERKRAEDALLLEKNYSDRLFDAPNDTVFLFEPSTGKPIRWNKRFSEESGYTDDEIAGMKAPRDFYDKADLNKATEAIARNYTANVTVELSLVAKQGAHIPFEYSATPIETTDGKTLILSIGRNITERKVAEEALRKVNKKLNLLSGITRHDLKNQLLSLNGYLEISKRYLNDATKMSEFITKEEKIVKNMERQIAFTKEYEKIDVNAPVWQDLRTLVNHVAKQATQGQILVKNDFPDGAEMFADPLIVKVFFNLMDNAARHGGKITTLRFFEKESGDQHTIVCEDDGNGVVAEEKERIFERGFGKNTGMGLFLAREILDITGITIRETGEPGKGARFEMTVPKVAWRTAKDA